MSKKDGAAIAASIIATVDACRAVVNAFADGRLKPELPHGTRDSDFRFAPCFRRDMPHDSSGVPYTIGSIVLHFLDCGKDVRINNGGGHTAPSRWLQLAMALLEGSEEQWLDLESTLNFIREGRPGYRVNALLRELRARRQAHKLLSATQSPYQLVMQ